MVYEHIMTLISVINPARNTYVCFDGVQHFKMLQQRQRRFKSVLTKQILQSQESWNTNHITPGTFYDWLDDYLSQKFKNQKNYI